MRYPRTPSLPVSATSYGRGVQPAYVSIPLVVQYLVIGGGASGGFGNIQVSGGGGGAGGYRCSFNGDNSGTNVGAEIALVLSTGSFFPVKVGTGGATVGPATVLAGNIVAGLNGNPSSFGPIESIGGGGGGAAANVATPASNGGSGGGGGAAATSGVVGNGTVGQGKMGGTGFPSATVTVRSAGGGGGAGFVGVNGASTVGGNGGAGIASSITGTSITRGGGGGGSTTLNGGGTQGTGGSGGGGAASVGNVLPGNGSANTGGGGGGISNNNTVGGGTVGSGSGGSGVVIIRYPDVYTAIFSAGVTQTTATSGRFKVSTITATSTINETVTFK